MKIVIDIEEGWYNWIMSHASNHPVDYANSEDLCFRKAVESGTVLPNGHGRLIDADKLLPTCKFRGDCPDEKCEICSDNAVSFSDIDNAPTIIEADTEVD